MKGTRERDDDKRIPGTYHGIFPTMGLVVLQSFLADKGELKYYIGFGGGWLPILSQAGGNYRSLLLTSTSFIFSKIIIFHSETKIS